MSQYPYITYRRHTFLSALAMGFSAIVIALLVCGTVTVIYGVHLAGEKSERVIMLAQDAVRGLPEFAESLPPALSDMLDDRRQPDYRGQLAITARLTTMPGPSDRTCTAIEVVNNGNEVVSLLGLRVLTLDERGRLLSERQEWAATPFATDGGLRGPIMPGSRRYFVGSCGRPCDLDPMTEVTTEIEVTELRVWNDPRNAPAVGHEAPAEATAAAPSPAESPENG